MECVNKQIIYLKFIIKHSTHYYGTNFVVFGFLGEAQTCHFPHATPGDDDAGGTYVTVPRMFRGV